MLASRVDTGSRGRPGKKSKSGVTDTSEDSRGTKRKRVTLAGGEEDAVGATSAARASSQASASAPIQAASGFTHILPPTPEAWTASLPHRTQVVYTPDYSYVIQAMRIRPGSVVLEAGGGSGSFTHAAARAVFSGDSTVEDVRGLDEKASFGDVKSDSASTRKKTQRGRVYTFEYHEPRAKQLQHEIEEHGLEDVVTVTHRDVYGDGFCLDGLTSSGSSSGLKQIQEVNGDDKISNGETTASDDQLEETSTTNAPSSKPELSPQATAVFLDLPAPWRCLPHLSRSPPSVSSTPKNPSDSPTTHSRHPISPLNPHHPTHLTSFLPCLEQATRLLSALRTHGWTEIRMINLDHRRVEVRRERTGLRYAGERGVNAVAATVGESVAKLRKVEGCGRGRNPSLQGGGDAELDGGDAAAALNGTSGGGGDMKEDVQVKTVDFSKVRKPYNEGTLVTRTEPEIKSHTGYLVSAVLPVAWGPEQEAALREQQKTEARRDVDRKPNGNRKMPEKVEARGQQEELD